VGGTGVLRDLSEGMLVKTHTGQVAETYREQVDEHAGKFALTGPALCPEATIGETKWGGPFDPYGAGAGRAYRVHKVDRDDLESIESIGDKLLSPPVKGVVHATPRGASTLNHVEEKVNTSSADEVRTPHNLIMCRLLLSYRCDVFVTSVLHFIPWSIRPLMCLCMCAVCGMRLCSVWRMYPSTASWWMRLAS
jgi:hypothetical protein